MRTYSYRMAVALLLLLCSALLHAASGSVPPVVQARGWEANKGQFESASAFRYSAPGLSVWLTADKVVYDLYTLSSTASSADASPVSALSAHSDELIRTGHVVFQTFRNARLPLSYSPLHTYDTKYHYLIGNDRSRWATDVTRSSRVRSSDVWKHIDVEWYLDSGNPRYDIVVRPGGKPSDIVLEFKGAHSLSVDSAGTLLVHTSQGAMRHSNLVAWQLLGADTAIVPAAFEVVPGIVPSVRLAVGPYDKRLPLVIDPLVWSTYHGTDNEDVVHSVDYMPNGDIVAVGRTVNDPGSNVFSTPGAYQRNMRSAQDGFVTRFSSNGTTRRWTTYLGSRVRDELRDTKVHSDGSIYLVGHTAVDTLKPIIPNTYPTTHVVSVSDSASSIALVSVLSPTGDTLKFSCLLGGRLGFDLATGLDVDSLGRAHVVGITGSQDFPRRNAYRTQPPNTDLSKGFYSVVNPYATQKLHYSTYIGTNVSGVGSAGAMDVKFFEGRAYIVGFAEGAPLIIPVDTTANRLPLFGAGSQSAGFLVVVNPDTVGTPSLLYGTPIGGRGYHVLTAVDVDSSGIAIAGFARGEVTGAVSPILHAPNNVRTYDSTYQGSSLARDADITVFRLASLQVLQSSSASYIVKMPFATFLGGLRDDAACDILKKDNLFYLLGGTFSDDFPITSDAYQSERTLKIDPNSDLVFARLNTAETGASSLEYSSLFGGSNADGLISDYYFNDNNFGFYDPSFDSDKFTLQDEAFLAIPLARFGESMRVDTVVVGGMTASNNFPFTRGARDSVFNDGTVANRTDGFVMRFSFGASELRVVSPTTATAACAGSSVPVVVFTQGIQGVRVRLLAVGSSTGTVLVANADTQSGGLDTITVALPANLAVGTYYLRVEAIYGSNRRDSTAIITVDRAPVIAGNLTNETINRCLAAGFAATETITFTASIETSTTATRAWQRSTDGGVSWTTVATVAAGTPGSDTYNVTVTSGNIASLDQTRWRYVASNACGTVVSGVKTLFLGQRPWFITTIPDDTLCADQTYTLSVQAGGFPAPAITWGENVSPFIVINTGTSWTFAADAAKANMRVQLSNNCATETDNFLLHVNPVVLSAAVTGPDTVLVCEGESFTLGGSASVRRWQVLPIANGMFAPREWQYWNGSAWVADPVGDVIANPSGSSLSASLTVDSPTASVYDGRRYRFVAGTACDTVVSDEVVLRVFGLPVITSQPRDTVVCPGGTATFTLGVVGDTTVAIQWYSVSQPTSIATGPVLTRTVAQQAGGPWYAEIYYPLLGEFGCKVYSDTVGFTVSQPVTVSQHPVSGTICNGASTTLTIVATGDVDSLRWEDSAGNPIPGQTSASFTTTAAGQYRARLYSACGQVLSNIATINAASTPALLATIADTTLCVGESVVWQPAADGSLPITWQWEFSTNGGASWLAPAQSTQQQRTVVATAALHGSLWRVTASNICGSTSAVAVLNVNIPVQITAQPAGSDICQGSSTTLTVTAAGSVQSYQWLRDGSSLPGATSPSLLVTTAGLYSVRVAGPCGVVTSATAAVNILVSPVIISGITPHTVCSGQAISYGVVSSGSDPRTYQWSFSSDGGGTWTSVSTSPSYSVTVNSSFNGRLYRVQVSNRCGIATTTAQLTVLEAPVIALQPSGADICPSSTTTLTVLATGSDLGYAWLRNGTQIPGAQTSTLTVSAAGAYAVVVSNTCGTVTSATAQVNILVPPAIAANPVNAVLCFGESTTLTITLTGDYSAVRWLRDGELVSTGLTVTLNAPASTSTWQALVQWACGEILSSSVTVTVQPLPVVTFTPASSVCIDALPYALTSGSPSGGVYSGPGLSGGVFSPSSAGLGTHTIRYDVTDANGCSAWTTATITVQALPTVAISAPAEVCAAPNNIPLTATAAGGAASIVEWRWYKNGVLSGTSATGSFTLTELAAGTISVGVAALDANGCATETITTAIVSVGNTPQISSQPTSSVVCAGSSVSLAVSASAVPAPQVQWQRRNGLAWVAVSTSSSYSFTAAMADSGAVFRAIASNRCGADTTVLVRVDVLEAPQVLAHPADAELCPGSSTTLSVTATGSRLAYQWLRNGNPLPGETSPTLSVSQGGFYSVRLTNTCGVVLSNPAQVTLLTPPVLAVAPSSLLICTDKTTTLSVAVAGDHSSVRWRRDGVVVGTGLSLPIGGLSPGTYSVVAEALWRCGVATSATVVVTVNPLPVVTLSLASRLCVDDAPIALTGGSPSGGVYSGSGVTGFFFDPSAAGPGTAVIVYTYTDANGCSASSSASIEVRPLPVVSLSATSPVCAGEQTVRLTASVSGTPTAPVQYSWFEDGSPTPFTVTASASVAVTRAPGTYSYTVRVQDGDGCRSALSNAVSVRVRPGPQLTANPSNTTVCVGQPAGFSAAWTSDPAPEVVWEISRNGGGVWQTLPGTSPSVSFVAAVADSGALVRVRISTVCGADTSASAVLSVLSPPSVAAQPRDTAVCEGSSVSFSVVARGDGLQYRWYKGAAPIAGATSPSLTLLNVTPADSGSYSVEVSGACAPPVFSAPALLTVYRTPTISTQPPAEVQFCEGGSTTITVTAAGTGLRYRWTRNDIEIPGSSAASLAVVLPGVYKAEVYGQCAPSAFSTEVVAHMLRKPVLERAASFAPVECSGSPVEASLVLRNVSTAPLRMRPLTTSNPAFAVVSPAGAFAIPPGDSAVVVVRFASTRAGTFTANLIADMADCPDLQERFPLSVRVDSARLASVPEIVLPSMVSCDTSRSGAIEVSNTGTVDLTITDVVFDDPVRFALNGSTVPIAVPAGTTVSVGVTFTPNGASGAILGGVSFVADRCGIQSRTAIRTRVDSVKIALIGVSDTLDFGVLDACQDEVRRTVTLRNTGTVVTRIVGLSNTGADFRVENLVVPFDIQPGRDTAVSVLYTGATQGVATSQLRFTADRCPVDVSVVLRGRRLRNNISADVSAVDFGTVVRCPDEPDTRDTTVQLINSGTDAATVSLLDMPAGFTVTPGALPVSLQPGQSFGVPVVYAPAVDGPATGIMRLVVTAGSCVDTMSFALAAERTTPAMSLSSSSLSLPSVLECEPFSEESLVIANTGTQQLTLTVASSSPDFAVVAGAAMVLQPGQQGTVTVRFAGTAVGATSAVLTVASSECSLSETVAMQAERQRVDAEIVAFDDMLSFEVIECQGDESAPRRARLLHRSGTGVQGTVRAVRSSDHFAVDLVPGAVLADGAPLDFAVVFRPTAYGTLAGSVEVEVDFGGCVVTDTLVLSGTHHRADLEADRPLVAFGAVTEGVVRTEDVVITNTGTVPLTVSLNTLAAPFRIVTPLTPTLTLAPSSQATVTVQFTSVVGAFADSLVAVSATPCDLRSVVFITATGDVAPQPRFVVSEPITDFGDVWVTTAKGMSVTLRNVGEAAGRITGASFIRNDGSSFALDASVMPTDEVEPGGEVAIPLDFLPMATGLFLAELQFETSSGEVVVASARGVGIPLPRLSVPLAVSDMRAAPGDIAGPVITGILPDSLAITAPQQLRIEMEYNPSVWYPRSSEVGALRLLPATGTSARRLELTLSLQDIAEMMNNTPREMNIQLQGDVLLGNAVESPLHLVAAEWTVSTGSVVSTLQDGSITLEDICTVGGTRLLQLNGTFGLTFVAPNPASSYVEIVAEVVGTSGMAELALYSLDGKKVWHRRWTLSREEGRFMQYTIPADELPTGVYTVVLTAPERKDTRQLMIAK